jgi:MFS family permease
MQEKQKLQRLGKFPNRNGNHHKPEEETEEFRQKITPDFNAMIRILFWNSMGFFFYGFVITYVSSQLMGATGIDIGVIFASMTFGGLISSPIVGYLTDRMSKKKLVLWGSAGRGTSYTITYFAIFLDSLPLFSVGVFMLGFGVGFFWPPYDSLVSQKSSKFHRSYAFGKRVGALGKGNFVGSMLSILIFSLATYLTPGNLLIIYSPLLLYTISNLYAGVKFNKNIDEGLTFTNYINSIQKNQNPEIQISENNKQEKIERENKPDYSLDIEKKNEIQDNSQDENSSHSTQNQSKKSKINLLTLGLLLLALGFFVSSFNQSVGRPFLQIYLIDNLGVTGVWVMVVYFPSEILSQLISPKLGTIADKIKPSLGAIITATSGAIFTLLLINAISPLIFGLLLIGDTSFAITGELILTNLLSRISTKHRGKIFGTIRWITSLGAIIGPIIGGMLWDNFGNQAPFIVSIFVELLIIPLYLISIKLVQSRVAEKV